MTVMIGELKVDWPCLFCGNKATVVGIVPKEMFYNTKYEKAFYVGETLIKGWASLEAKCEIIPVCDEHDQIGTSKYILKCKLTEEVKEAFNKINLENSRDIQL